MRDIDLFAKKALEAAVKVGVPAELNGVAEAVKKPEFATAIGLAMFAAEVSQSNSNSPKKSKKTKPSGSKTGFLKKIFSKF